MNLFSKLFKQSTQKDKVSTKLDRIAVQAGEFIMGSTTEQVWEFFQNAGGLVNTGSFDCERPQHRVYLDAFEIDKYPVTCEKYAKFSSTTGHPTPQYWKGNTPPKELLNHPVVEVSLRDAMAYCSWAGGRMPYETEWEKAARGTDGRIYSWGNEFDPSKSNSDKHDKEYKTQPVDAHPEGASPYGCMDMIGNVREWTSDVITPYPGYAAENWSTDSGGLKLTRYDHYGAKGNPVFWPNQSSVRGGGFETLRGYCRCSSRLPVPGDALLPYVGFRCVYAPDPNETGMQLLKKGRFNEAIRHFEKALQLSPVHAGILFNAAYCYQSAKQFKPAIELWEKLLESWPDDADASQMLQQCRQSMR